MPGVAMPRPTGAWALDRAEKTLYADLIPLLLATGCRTGETLSATWDQFEGDT